MNRVFFVLMVLLVLMPEAWAQKIEIGDKLPESIWSRSEVIKPNRSKLTVLDFWSHSCSSCIASFPKLNQLKKLFGDSVNIVLVNREPADSTARLFGLRDWITRPEVPMIAGDTLIHDQFQIWGLPFVVWLDENLIVRGFSGGSQLKERYIRRFLDGDDFGGNDYNLPKRVSSLFVNDYEGNLLAFSYLAKSQRGLNLASPRDEGELQQDIAVSKYTMEMLFKYAYDEDGKYNFRRSWQMQIIDFPIFVSGGEDADDSDIAIYDYALKLPTKDRPNRFVRMREDLDRYFTARSYVDTIAIKTAVLVATGNSHRMHSKGGKPQNTFRINARTGSNTILGEGERILVNQPYERFSRSIENLIDRNLEVPFIDNSNITGNVDVSFDYLVFEFFTMDLLQEALAKYGLKIEERSIQTPVLKIQYLGQEM